jgi:error-prone DNA polymerase
MGRRGSDLAAAARAAGAGESGGESSGESAEERVRRVLVHASGFRQSPYADIKPQGVDAADTRRQARGAQEERAQQDGGAAQDGQQPGQHDQHDQHEADRQRRSAPSKLWHSSPGSSGW